MKSREHPGEPREHLRLVEEHELGAHQKAAARRIQNEFNPPGQRGIYPQGALQPERGRAGRFRVSREVEEVFLDRGGQGQPRAVLHEAEPAPGPRRLHLGGAFAEHTKSGRNRFTREAHADFTSRFSKRRRLRGRRSMGKRC